MNLRKVKFLLVYAVTGIILLLGFFFFVLFVTSSAFPTPTKPKIKQAEIDFTLIYEINGQEREYSDSLVCRFDGIHVTSAGKTRKWKAWYKSKPRNNRIELYNIDDDYCIVLGVGTPRYFLSDPDVEYIPKNPYISIFNRSTGYYMTSTQQETEMLNKLGFKIVNWKCEEPVENIYT